MRVAFRERRRFLRGGLALTSLGLVAGCGLLTRTVPATRMARVGFLGTGGPSSPGRQLDNVKQGMTDLGYVEGEHYTVEARYAENNL